MKSLTVYNASTESLNLVLNFNQDILVQPQSSVVIQTDARFNSDDFYVEGEKDWSVKYNTIYGDLELYLSKTSWSDESYKMYGKKMQTV